MSAVESIPLKRIDGAAATLGDWSGKVRLVVNVASKCGLTPQYEALEALQKSYGPKGFSVMGFPANNFGAQEPGTNAEIVDFCTTNFGVDFPMFEKISVTGDDRHPLYDELVKAQPKAVEGGGALNGGPSLKDRLASSGRLPADETAVMWNFEKFLIGKDGKVVGRFAPDVAPQDPKVTSAIEAELAK